MIAEEGMGTKTPFVFIDSNFIYFLQNQDLGIDIFGDIERYFGTPIVTGKILNEIEEQGTIKGIYLEEAKEQNKKWRGIISKLNESPSNNYNELREKNSVFLAKAFNCFHPGIYKKGEMEFIVAAKTLQHFEQESIIISEDEHILFYSELLLSYFGFCLRVFSIFELLTYIDSLKYTKFLEAYTNYRNLRTYGANLDLIKNCNFKKDVIECMGYGFISTHPYNVDTNLFKKMYPKKR